jgi:hypothetical protein
MTTYNHHSARIRTHYVGGVFIADYSGFFVPQAWVSLGMQTEHERRLASVSVDKMYPAAHDADERLDGISFDYLVGTRPGVWIVRPDQQATALHVSRRLAGMGVVRTVFLRALEPLALEFARAQCLVSCQ